MCQKSCQVFKQFYAVILMSPVSVTRSLQVFKVHPTKEQLENVVTKHVIGKIEYVPHIYSEKTRVEVVPIHIPVDILYH